MTRAGRIVRSALIAPVVMLVSLSSGCAPTVRQAPAVLVAPGPLLSTIKFVDVSAQAGLDYQWAIPGPHPYTIRQTIGNGCAFLDYNNDGNLDILLVGPKLALYKGDGHGHFTDVTAQTGLDNVHGDFLGCAVGDYDNDGYEDIYLTAYRGGVLLHNDHGQRFTDVTAGSGIAAQPWGTSAAWIDLGDGRLSLYVGDYIVFGPNVQPQLCNVNGVMASCPPTMYKPLKGRLYRNLGAGKFADVTDAWNAGVVYGKTLGVAPADFDGSGRQSLYIANDYAPGSLLKNDGGRFTDIGTSSGAAIDQSGGEQNGMGVDWGDYDNDGRLDLVVETFSQQPTAIYHNEGGGVFTEESGALGIAGPTMPYIKFGVKWLDADNSGWLDLIAANGNVADDVAQIDAGETFREPTQLFYNEHGQRFADISATALAGDAGAPIVGRGLAIGDFDNDGKIDALVVDSQGRPLLLHNETPNAGHWLEIDLIGTKSNRDGQGALITLRTASLTLLRQCTTAGSYMSASDKRVHFGLGAATGAQSITIKWPSGHVDNYKNVVGDRVISITEGDSRIGGG
jgi:enediyne biosynthesis protein E4